MDIKEDNIQLEMDLCKESKISVHNFLILFVNLGNMFMIVVL